jgi:membrane-bound lytic murein transglycosylase B
VTTVLTLNSRLINSIIFALISLSLLIASPSTAWPSDGDLNFKSLQTQLINDKDENFSQKQIRGIFKNPGVDFDIKGISSYFRHQEGKLNYDQFLSAKSIRTARNYIWNHYSNLLKAEIDYGVDMDVITAIMLVETRFGSYVGNRPVINILSTMAALENPKVRDAFWKKIPTENRVTKAEYEKKAAKKANWAYKELKAFLKYVLKEKLDPYSINGSYAGAMGLCQFMPSNIITLAKDGNEDGKINLFHHEDAIVSIANYLKRYGWKPGINREEAGKVVYHYNHSKYYVNTVLNIADKLKT